MVSGTHSTDRWSNGVFSLGWLEDPRLASGCVSSLAKIASHLKGTGAYESDTAAIFVEPVLRGLGWETLDHDEVDRAPRGPYPDYTLYGKDGQGTPKLLAIIEVKRLDYPAQHLWVSPYKDLHRYIVRRFGNPKFVVESVVAPNGEPVVCGVVTNGRSWHVYDFRGEKCDAIKKHNFDLGGRPDLRAFVETLGRGQLGHRLGLLRPGWVGGPPASIGLSSRQR